MLLGQGVAGPAQLVGDALLTPHSGLLGVCVGQICRLYNCRQQGSQDVSENGLTRIHANVFTYRFLHIAADEHTSPLYLGSTKATQRLRSDYGQVMISRITAVSSPDNSPDSVDVPVASSFDWGVVPTTVVGGMETIPQVGDSPARTEKERPRVKATVNMNRFMELAPSVT